ncbi:MAG: UDP-N-acetylmuramate dehydrogenase [Actinobacteria bacterium]|nr:UDP-N-acetylmuramate dehydrogenase [Actinomycetota bacterium]
MNGALQRIADDLSDAGLAVQRDVSVAHMTTYRVGGSVGVFVDVADAGQLVALAAVTARHDAETLVIGNGSNLLVADGGAAVVAVRLGPGFEQIEIDATTVIAGGAARLPVVARRSVAAGLTGFEWAVGVPGSIGGAVRMNAGGHGSDMAKSVASVRVLDLRTGQDETMSGSACEFGYRRSRFGSSSVVLSASLALSAAADPAASERELSEIVQWRRAHQPGGQNAGSVFTNPPGESAGRLIDTAGCKGLRVGSAQVSDKHANFIQADPAGSADDVAALMGEVVQRVRSVHGVTLHPETVMVGFDAGVLERAGVLR